MRYELKNQLSSKVDAQKIIKYGMALALIATFITALFSNGESFFLLFHSDPRDSFMDFFNSIYDASFRNPYEARKVIYPPLTYLYYHFCGKFMDHSIFKPMGWRNDQQGLLVYLSITFLTVAMIHYVLSYKKEGDRCFPTLLLFGTVPFWYTYERGNLILQALLFLAFFVVFYDSKNSILRELALISLAISASLKIYPALFGLLLLRDRKFGAAVRCVFYGLSVLFLPFVYYGGMDCIKTLIANLSFTNNLFGTLGYGYKVNLLNTINFVAELTVNPRHLRSIVFLLMGGCITVTVLLSKQRWQFLAALASAMILFPGFSYTYTLVFMAIPLWDFYHHGEKNRKISWVYALLFVLMFCPIPFGGSNPFGFPDAYYDLGLTTAVSSISLVIFVIVLAADSVITFFRCRKKVNSIQ